jgi:hypothetical protein
MQKQTSINPKAGIGKWSFDFVLNNVFLMLAGVTNIPSANELDTSFFDDLFEVTGFGSVLAFSLPNVDFLEGLVFLIFFCFLQSFPVSGSADSLGASSFLFVLFDV